MAEIESLINAAFAAYESGERKKGAHLLQDIQNIIHPGRFTEYEARKGKS